MECLWLHGGGSMLMCSYGKMGFAVKVGYLGTYTPLKNTFL
jgi:hypothetical protein